MTICHHEARNKMLFSFLRLFVLYFLFLNGTFLLFNEKCIAKEGKPLVPDHPERLPQSLDGRTIAPDLGCFWSIRPSFQQNWDEYKGYLDTVGGTGAYDAFLLTIRSLNSLTDMPNHIRNMRDAAEYAQKRLGIGVLLDIDLRISRTDFEKKYPQLLQERLCLASDEFKEKALEMNFSMSQLSDHYTGNYPYYVRKNRFIKAWSFRKDSSGSVLPGTITDISDKIEYQSKDAQHGTVRIPANVLKLGDFVCAAVAFAVLYPDLFSQEAFDYDSDLYLRYKSVPALGITKDEWGFPPDFNRQWNRDYFWFSTNMAKAYGQKTNGRSLVDDFFLIYLPCQGKEKERLQAMDDFNHLYSDRVLEYEDLLYNKTKEIWGSNAFVGVHGTWFPWPNALEFRKNGLMWWRMKRDYAQTDEYVPFCCRNGMAKATNSIWYNMYYASNVPPYLYEHWTAALSSGRVHIHTLYPRSKNTPATAENYGTLPIINGGVGQIRAKVRLVNFITNSPIESSIAVVFGHYGAMNPLRPEYQKVGVDLCDLCALAGYPADLVPSDEINSVGITGEKRWKRNVEGYLQYGIQSYRYIIFYGVNDSDRTDFNNLVKLAGTDSRTKIITIDPLSSMTEQKKIVNDIVANLQKANIPGHTPWTPDKYQFSTNTQEQSTRPGLHGMARLVDGTLLFVSAKEKITGDNITMTNIEVVSNDGNRKNTLSACANGILACRFDDNGKLSALAAAGLKLFQGGGQKIILDENTPVDIALWKDSNGQWKGVFQSDNNKIPAPLLEITSQWYFLKKP